MCYFHRWTKTKVHNLKRKDAIIAYKKLGVGSDGKFFSPHVRSSKWNNLKMKQTHPTYGIFAFKYKTAAKEYQSVWYGITVEVALYGKVEEYPRVGDKKPGYIAEKAEIVGIVYRNRYEELRLAPRYLEQLKKAA